MYCPLMSTRSDVRCELVECLQDKCAFWRGSACAISVTAGCLEVVAEWVEATERRTKATLALTMSNKINDPSLSPEEKAGLRKAFGLE